MYCEKTKKNFLNSSIEGNQDPEGTATSLAIMTATSRQQHTEGNHCKHTDTDLTPWGEYCNDCYECID